MNFGRTWRDGAAIEQIGEEIQLICDYDEKLIERIKEEIHPSERRWDPKRNCWWFPISRTHQVQCLVRECLGEMVMVKK